MRSFWESKSSLASFNCSTKLFAVLQRVSMLLRKSLFSVHAKLSSVARYQQLRNIRIPGAGKEVPRTAAKLNQRVNVQDPTSESNVKKVFNFGIKYGPTLFKVVSATIANGPKVLFGLFVCGSVGYLYYLKNYYGIKYDSFKSGVADKLKGAKNKVSESMDSVKASANAARDRAGQSIESARDTVRGSYEKVTNAMDGLNPIPAIAEQTSAAKDKLVKTRGQVADKVAELKGQWTSSTDSSNKSSEPKIPLSEQFNALKQKAAEKMPSFGRKPVAEVKAGDNAGTLNDKTDNTVTDDTFVKKAEEGGNEIASKIADIKNKWSAKPNDGGQK